MDVLRRSNATTLAAHAHTRPAPPCPSFHESSYSFPLESKNRGWKPILTGDTCLHAQQAFCAVDPHVCVSDLLCPPLHINQLAGSRVVVDTRPKTAYDINTRIRRGTSQQVTLVTRSKQIRQLVSRGVGGHEFYCEAWT